MRIYYLETANTMIMGSIAELNQIHAQLAEFLKSERRFLRLPAQVSGGTYPSRELLPALEVEKTEGSIYVSLSNERALRIAGGMENLMVYAEFFRFYDDEAGSHHHPECVEHSGYIKPGSLSVIIEPETEYFAGVSR